MRKNKKVLSQKIKTNKNFVKSIKREAICNECNSKIDKNDSCYVIPIKSNGGYYLEFKCIECVKSK